MGEVSITELAERYRPEILAYLLRLTGNEHDAQDACQDAFLRAQGALGRLAPDSNVRAWLYRIATNCARSAARWRARRTSRTVDLHLDGPPARDPAGGGGGGGAPRRALDGLGRLYGEVTTGPARRPVYYCSLPTPIGPLLVGVTDAGLVRVCFRRNEASFVAELRERLGAEPVRSAKRTADIVRQLRAYFAGQRRAFDGQL